MADLSVQYMGYKLKNPIIVGSSSLTGNVDGVKRSEEAGAGAVVLKSLFEEQIMAEADDLESKALIDSSYHPEAMEYIYRMGMEHSRTEYLRFVENAVDSVKIPVFASLNCVSKGGWVDYARRLQDAGAAGLELNMYVTPRNPHTSCDDIERTYYDIIKEVKSRVSLPISVKVGPFFTNFYAFAENLAALDIDSLIIFNRFFQIDIDTDNMAIVPGPVFSTPKEMALVLRWTALLSKRIKVDLAATTGVVDGVSAVKLLLAGAKTVHVSSVLYRRGIGHVTAIVNEIEEWMKSKGFASTGEFIGKLAKSGDEHPGLYDRVQFIKTFVGLE
ncbi:MAG: dihydroorotate dehydrogenase-like protein [Planctomycetota bacterium]